eukprot:scaffold6249_cov124-Isochrysis_galbana.AAC.5
MHAVSVLCAAAVALLPAPQGHQTRLEATALSTSLPASTARAFPVPLAATVALTVLTAAPFAAVADGAALFENAAAPGDVGVRPTICGVNLFFFYAVSQVLFQIYLRLRPGGPNLAFINGTRTSDGKPAGLSPFKRKFEDIVRQATEASKRAREGRREDR